MAIGSGHCPRSGTRECSRLREGPGSGKKRGEELGVDWKEGGAVGGGGEPCPSVPSVPGAHPAGKPWGRSCSGRPAQNSLPSGQGCPGQRRQRPK